jgi:PAT family beta-lactamase induction signal transducer AmpG
MNWRELFKSRRLAMMLPLGFASGLPLALSGGTLQAWLAVDGVDISTIGLFSMVGLPYTLKFAWSPLMDRFCPPILGRRRGWMVVTQILLAAVMAAMAFANPARAPFFMALLAFSLAALSASQDIVFDAYRTDILEEHERGLGAGLTVTGYRIAMILSGAVALVLADHMGWHSTYLFMAAVMACTVIVTIFSPDAGESCANTPASIAEAVTGPLKQFFSRHGAWAFLAMIILYKLGDAFAGTLTTAFLIRGPGFSPTDVGTINKGFGLVATLAGALAGGSFMARLSLYRSLMLFGILQAVSNLSFMMVALLGKSYPAMIFAVGFENLSGGMGTAAFVAFLMALCDRRYSATQYALLSAMASMGRVFVGPPSGFLAEATGWPVFFLITTFAAIPGLVLLFFMRNRVNALSVRSAG